MATWITIVPPSADLGPRHVPAGPLARSVAVTSCVHGPGVAPRPARWAYRADPSVSLLLTTSPGRELDAADRARLRVLAGEDRHRLGAHPDHARGRIAPVLTDLDEMVGELRGPVHRAVALFASPARVARFDLPVEVVDRCVIDPTFAARDLLVAVDEVGDVGDPDVLDDAVDELMEAVLGRGGWVALLVDGTLPSGSRVALTVRT